MNAASGWVTASSMRVCPTYKRDELLLDSMTPLMDYFLFFTTRLFLANKKKKGGILDLSSTLRPEDGGGQRIQRSQNSH